MGNKIVLNLAISLDGFIADEAGGYSWIQPAGDPALNTTTRWAHDEFIKNVGAVVMGKNSYDQQLHTEFRDVPVYVAASKPPANHDNIRFISGDIPQQVRGLCSRTEGDVYLFGGGILIHPLLQAGLVDEYIIGVIPIILGSGIPLFLPNGPTIPLQLTHFYVEDGIVVLRYIPRGVAEK